ncbi:MAG: hypothetical protein AB7G47_19785 [Mycolicibacterium sp.]|uniref:hypothetical protein n=1 Tax=Mycolicibacterium sp. TaxID=2320850 RepID=UPI003D10A6C5
MPTTSSTEIQILRHQDPATGHQLTRVQFRGWQVDISGTTISLPQHTLTAGQTPIDLAVCLDAARTLIQGPRRPAPSPPRSAPLPPPIDHNATVAAVLAEARTVAATHWHPTLCDIYECTSTAWTASGMRVGYATLTRALRAALPEGMRLIAFNDAATRDDICSFFDRAISLLDTPPTALNRGVA